MIKFTWRGLEFKPRVPGDGHVLVSNNWKIDFRRPNEEEWSCFASWSCEQGSYSATYTGRQSHQVIAAQALEELKSQMTVGLEWAKERVRELSNDIEELDDLEPERQTS